MQKLIGTHFKVVTRLCPQLESIRNNMLINPALFRTLQFTPRKNWYHKYGYIVVTNVLVKYSNL